MNCRYKNNPEIYENFILNRLSGEEKEQFLEHVKGCAFCREELKKQQTIITAIRRSGSEEMKKEIRAQVAGARKKSSDIDWSMYLKIAAAVLFFVIAPGILYYYQHVSPGLDSGKHERIIHREQMPAGNGDSVLLEADEGPAEEKIVPEKRSQIPYGDSKSPSTGPEKSRPTVKAPEREFTEKLNMEGSQQPGSAEDNIKPEFQVNETDKVASNTQSLHGARAVQDKLEKTADSPDAREKLPAYPTPEELPLESVIALKKTYAESTAYSYALVIEGKINKIYLFLDIREADYKLSDDGYPLIFPVHILRRDTSGLHMVWTVPPGFPVIDGSRVQIVEEQTDTISFSVQPDVLYEISLASDTSEAVLVSKDEK
ncbi:MAG: hypothetical protein EH225_09480 [Calditrichaeota bacterium]|nr:MAG: hypothetical protein EH225_09480 [Calditrichota bacterium]